MSSNEACAEATPPDCWTTGSEDVTLTLGDPWNSMPKSALSENPVSFGYPLQPKPRYGANLLKVTVDVSGAL